MRRITSSGIAWPVSGRHDPASRCDVLAIVAGFGAAQMTDRRLVGQIYRSARNATIVMGIESGPWLLARAGLLDEHRAATHWEDFEDFAAAFPNVDLRPDRYVVDGRFITTSGRITNLRHDGGPGAAGARTSGGAGCGKQLRAR
jgi:transcriptional regulator GlxA family with amidase domain